MRFLICSQLHYTLKPHDKCPNTQGDDLSDPLHGLGGGGGLRPATEAVPDTALLCNDQPLEVS